MLNFPNLSLSKKILFGILPLFIIFVTISVIVENHFQEEVLVEEASVAAITYANIIKESLVSMMVNDLRVDTTFIQRVSGFQQFDTVRVYSNKLFLRPEIVHQDSLFRRSGVGRTATGDSMVSAVMRGDGPVFLRGSSTFRAVIPFQATHVCQKCHAVDVGYALGAADLLISFDRINTASRSSWNRSVVIFLLFCLFAITVASLTLSRFVTRPVDRLVRATTHMARELFGASESGGGQLAGDGTIRSHDEINVLTFRFEQMKATLRGKIVEISEARAKLASRNEEVERALQQLRKAQEELVRNERLAVAGRMTAQLSHEINNPIHNIQSLLESSLRKLKDQDEVYQLVTVAQEEVSRMAKLTRQMLDFSRGNAFEPDPEPFDIGKLLNDLVTAYRLRLEQRGILLALTVGSSLPPVTGSVDKIKQVFVNLLLNAADAIETSGSITLNAVNRAGTIEVTVSDTGTGIASEHLGRIFDAFFTTKKEVSGVGLGLFVSYGIVQQHGGTIRVESVVGKGARFIVILPIDGASRKNGE